VTTTTNKMDIRWT